MLTREQETKKQPFSELFQFFRPKKKQVARPELYQEIDESIAMTLGVVCVLIPGAIRPVVQLFPGNFLAVTDMNQYGNDTYNGSPLDYGSKDGSLFGDYQGLLHAFIAVYKLLDAVRTTMYEATVARAPTGENLARRTPA